MSADEHLGWVDKTTLKTTRPGRLAPEPTPRGSGPHLGRWWVDRQHSPIGCLPSICLPWAGRGHKGPGTRGSRSYTTRLKTPQIPPIPGLGGSPARPHKLPGRHQGYVSLLDSEKRQNYCWIMGFLAHQCLSLWIFGIQFFEHITYQRLCEINRLAFDNDDYETIFIPRPDLDINTDLNSLKPFHAFLNALGCGQASTAVYAVMQTRRTHAKDPSQV